MTRASNLKDIHLMSTVAFCNSRFEEMLSNEMQPDNFAYNALCAQHVSVMFLLFFKLSIPIWRFPQMRVPQNHPCEWNFP